ncbi:MAG: hypothetical protein ACUVRX_11115 [Actinomycetota bacterium]
MSKFYLIVRIAVLVALFFLLAAAFWGIANRDKTVAHGNEEIAVEYWRTKPAAYTSYLLITFVVLGIFVVLGSIIYDYHEQYREKVEDSRMQPDPRRTLRAWKRDDA